MSRLIAIVALLALALAAPAAAQVVVGPKQGVFLSPDAPATIAKQHLDVFAWTCTAATPPVCTAAATPIGAGVDLLESSVVALAPPLATGQNWSIDLTVSPAKDFLATLTKSNDPTCKTPGCYVATLTPTGTDGLTAARSAASNPFSLPVPPAPPAIETLVLLR